MKTKIPLGVMLILALALPPAALILAQQTGAGRNGVSRPEGPCDVYAAGDAPCVAAHSSTRAMYASYNGPLYQVMRQSDGKTQDIGVVQPSATDGGGYADAAVQDTFCANTVCWITTLYDQSGHGNNLIQAPRGNFSGPAMGGANNLPVADMAPITIMGHKVYGVFIEPGMGLRWNNAKGTAVDDQSEGQYWVVNGHHYNSGCCFDYGNAETDSRDDGNGTMETTYFGSAGNWYHGPPPGPWVMTDQENNLVGCVNADGSDKNCAGLPNMKARFVTGMAKGEAHHWTSLGGDAQKGELQVMFDGPRVNNSYDPMRKQGGILLGNGGDNSNGSQGTFYEGAMTAAKTFPSDATDQKVQANIVAARYEEARVAIGPAAQIATPPGLQTFSPGSTQQIAVSFTNTTEAPLTGVTLSITTPAGWTSVADGSSASIDRLPPGTTAVVPFKVTSGTTAFNGDLVGSVQWTTASGQKQTEKTVEKVRNVSPIKINEFAVGSNTPSNATNSFIELYNAGESDVDVSNWTLTEHATQQAIFSAVTIPAGTKVAAKSFYVLGLSDSGLAIPAHKGDTTLYVRSAAGMNVGDTVEIDTGSGKETHKIASIGRAASAPTTLWQPLPDGPTLTIPTGSTNVPVASVAGFEVGDKIAIGYGTSGPAVAREIEQYEVATITEVGKPGTQTALGADAKAGDASIQVKNVANIQAGDKLTLDIASVDHGIETVTVSAVETQAPPAAVAPGGAGPGPGGRGGFGRGPGAQGTVHLSAPLKFNHAANLPMSARGTGISFQPATAFVHMSNEPVQPLGVGITIDGALAGEHAINAAVRDAAVTIEGYQGAANQWFGGPALSNAGNMVLRDAAGLIVDSLNYGGLVDPWAAEGYQAAGGSGRSGCSVASPAAARGGFGRGGFGRGRGAPAATAPAVAVPNRSAGRVTDGADTDSNCADFQLQSPTPGAPNQRPQ